MGRKEALPQGVRPSRDAGAGRPGAAPPGPTSTPAPGPSARPARGALEGVERRQSRGRAHHGGQHRGSGGTAGPPPAAKLPTQRAHPGQRLGQCGLPAAHGGPFWSPVRSGSLSACGLRCGHGGEQDQASATSGGWGTAEDPRPTTWDSPEPSSTPRPPRPCS